MLSGSQFRREENFGIPEGARQNPDSGRRTGVALLERCHEIPLVRGRKKHILVDGHNVLHAWGWAASEDLAAARARLVASLRPVHDFDDADVTVVFDGRDSASRVDPATGEPGFVVRYAAIDLTADGEIEQLVAGDGDPARCVVVTADGQLRGNVLAAGGDCLSPDGMRSWIERCELRARRKLGAANKNGAADFGHRLPL
jgi:predicted RNA-binding protein with PIN domain